MTERIIANIACGTPPHSMTRSEAAAWQAADRRRMYAEAGRVYGELFGVPDRAGQYAALIASTIDMVLSKKMADLVIEHARA